MKYDHLFFGLVAVLMVSCTVEEITPSGIVDPEAETFYAYTEARSGDEDTKVFIDAENSRCIRWNKDDRITVFNRNTGVAEYAFTGEDGSWEGDFAKIQSGNGTAQGDALPLVYAVYPHSGETSIQADGTIAFNLPATQYHQRDGSFGKDANVMVARTDNDVLMFKNACGYLTLRFYGPETGISISSITLQGRENEILAGPGTITMSSDGIPSLTMEGGENMGTVRIFCKDVVELSKNDKNSCKEFWFVLPPVEFTKGFEITVATSNGGVFTKSTSKPLTIERNRVKRMAPLQVDASDNTDLSLDSLTTMFGKEETLDDAGNVISIVDKTYTATPDDNLTCTFTMPTFTDFTNFVLEEYAISDGAVLKVDDKVIVKGETSIDVTNPVSLSVCSGDSEKRYTLIVRNTGLPVVRITTKGFTRKDIEDDENHETWRPTKEETTSETASAKIRIEYADGTPALFKVTKNGETGAVESLEPKQTIDTQIKGRGNSSWKFKKRPYALKFDKKMQVFDMPPSKRWILLANWIDRTLLRNDAAFWLSRQISDVIKSPSFPYSVHGQFVELEFNGVHRGNYYLCEQIKIEESRLNINDFSASDISGGYLMEIDCNYDEQYKFLSGFYKNGSTAAGLKYMFKNPDENLPDNAFDYMKNYILEMEALIKKIPQGNYGYRDYIDMDSAIWFMFVNELTGNGDFFNSEGKVGSTWYGPHSTYMYKDRDVNADGTITRSKLFMGPVWDFDFLTFYDKSGSPSRSKKWVGVAKNNYYYYYFTQDPAFRRRAYELWNTYKPIIEDAMLTYIENMKEYISLSEGFNTSMWGWSGTDQNQNGDNGDDFATAVAKMKSAFTTKLNFMDGRIKENATTRNYRNY